MRKLRSIFPMLLGLALALAATGGSCIPNDPNQGGTIESTDYNSSAEWPPRDPTAVQACMELDPDKLASSLPPEFINSSTYCQTDSDCYCQSGSGVPFVGCANAYHARISFAGCYACNECVCIDNTCRLN